MVILDLEEVVTIEREEWKSVETNSGGECVMMNGMKETRLLCADNWDFQKKVYSHHKDWLISCSMSITISDAEADVATESVPNQFGTSTLPFLLDDVGCNGSERNLLDCLPQHNCHARDPKNENAGVHCLRKGIILFCIV